MKCFNVSTVGKALLVAAAVALTALAGSAGAQEHESEKYLAFKYKFPIETPVKWGGLVLEWGKVRDDGFFSAFDLSGAFNGDGFHSLGGGETFGYALELPEGLRAIAGLSLGFWMSWFDGKGGLGDTFIYDFFGPTVRVQWHGIEVSYRWLMGYYSVEDGSVTAGRQTVKVPGGSGFDYRTNHQLTLGYCISRDDIRSKAMLWNFATPGLGTRYVMNEKFKGKIMNICAIVGLTLVPFGFDIDTLSRDPNGVAETELKMNAVGYTGLTIFGLT